MNQIDIKVSLKVLCEDLNENDIQRILVETFKEHNCVINSCEIRKDYYNELSRVAVCTIERPDGSIFEIERYVNPKMQLAKVRDLVQKEYGNPYIMIYNLDGTKTKYLKKDAYYVFSCRWKDSKYRFINRKPRHNNITRKEVK